MKFKLLSKRGFSLFLTIAMCLSLLSVGVFAAEAIEMTGDEFLELAENGTIVLENDVVLTGTVRVTETLTLELGDHNMDLGDNSLENFGALTIYAGLGGIHGNDVVLDNYGTLTIAGGTYTGAMVLSNEGTVTIEEGTTFQATSYVLQNSGTVTIRGGAFAGGGNKGLIKGEGGSVTIEDGTFTSTNANPKPLMPANGGASIVITGGNIDCGLAENSNVTVTGGNFPQGTDITGFLDQDELTVVVTDEDGKQTILTGDAAVEAVKDGADAYLGGASVKNEEFVTVTLERNDGSDPESHLVKKGTAITLESLTRGGCYAFTGWLNGEVAVSGEIEILDDVTLSAQWIESHDLHEIPATEPTCAVEGTEAYQLCGFCEKLFDMEGAPIEAPTTIEKTEHSWNDGEVTKEATTTETGVRTFTCTICAATDEREIPTLVIPYIPGGVVPGPVGPTTNIDDEDVPLASILPFDDVAETDWFRDAVAYVYDNELMRGVSDNRFAPEAFTSRAMVVTMLYRMEGEPEAAASAFSDVPANAYYASAVAWAAANKIVSGYSETLFRPDDNISREQLAVILYRYASYKGINVTGRADLEGFSDAAQASGYALEALCWAVDAGLISGVNATTLDAGGNATRAQLASIMMRFCNNQLAK